MGKVSEAQIKELLASKYLMGVEDENGCRVNIPIEGLIEIIKENFKSNVDLFYNGIANINSEPEDDAVVEKSGFWFATDKGTYVEYGGVVNDSDLSIISIDEDGVFHIKTVVESFEGIISESFEEAKNALSDIIYDSIDTLNSDLNEYKANLNNDFQKFKSEVHEIAEYDFKGTISPTDAAPTVEGSYKPTIAGTYTNLGGLIAKEGYDTLFYFNGTTWSKSEVAFPVNTAKIVTWSASAYTSGSQVVKDGKIYEANVATVAGDVPGASSKWIEKVGGGDVAKMLKSDVEAQGTESISNVTNVNLSLAQKGMVSSGNAISTSGIGAHHLCIMNIDVTAFDRISYKAIKVQSGSGYSLVGKNSSGGYALSIIGTGFNINAQVTETIYDLTNVVTLSIAWFPQYGYTPEFKLYNQANVVSTKENFVSNKIKKIENVLKTIVENDAIKQVTEENELPNSQALPSTVISSLNVTSAFARTNTFYNVDVSEYDQLYFKGIRYATTSSTFQMTYSAILGITHDDKIESILFPRLESEGYPIEELTFDISKYKKVSIAYQNNQNFVPIVKLQKVETQSNIDFVYKNLGKGSNTSESNVTNVINETLKSKELELQAVERDSAWDFTTKPLRILHFSDIHKDLQRTKNFVSFLNALKVDFGVCSGDLVDSGTSDDFSFWANGTGNAQKKIYYCIGNHDVYNGVKADAVNKYFGANYEAYLGFPLNGETYYYVDRPTEKIRMIFLNEFEDFMSDNIVFTKTQLDWLAQTLKNTPSGYGVVIVKHKPAYLNTSTTLPDWNNNRWVGLDTDSAMGYPVEFMVQHFIDKTSMPSQTFGSVTINAVDFSTLSPSTEFVCYLGGHTHYDRVGFLQSYPKQLSIAIDCAILRDNVSDMRRVAGTISENVINHITINKDKKTITIIRLGADTTYDMKKRKSFTIKYNGN